MTRVSAGQTFQLSGTIATSGYLFAYAGNFNNPSGALIKVTGSATNNGEIVLTGGFGHSYTYNLTGATLNISGTLTNAASGLVYLNGGYPQYGVPGFIGAICNNSGSFANAGLVVVGGADGGYGIYGNAGTGAVLNDSGKMTNSGLLLVEGAPTIFSASSTGGTVDVSGVLTNSGSIRVDGGDLYRTYYGNIYARPAAGQISIAAGGTLTSSNNITLAGGYVKSYLRYYYPTIVARGATLTDAGVLINSGSLVIAGGAESVGSYLLNATLTVAATGSFSNSGTVIVGGGAGYVAFTGATLANAGTITNTGSILVGGSASPRGGAFVIDTGVLTNNGTITFQGGVTSSGTAEGAYLIVSRSLNNTGQITAFGGQNLYNPFSEGVGHGAVISDTGTISNSGTIFIGGEIGGLNRSDQGTSAGLYIAGTLTNSKLIEAQGGQTPAPNGKTGPYTPGVQIHADGILTNYGTIKLDAGIALHDRGATLTNSGTLTDSGTITGGGTLVNNGTILSGSGRAGALTQTAFLNQNLVKLTPGTSFLVNTPVTVGSQFGHGTFDITSGSTLTLDKSVGASQTVAFLNGASTLDFGSVSTFSGVLSGLHPTSTMDFLHTNVASASASGTTLTLTLSGGGTVKLKLAAPLPTGDTLNLSSDGAGGTLLRIGAPPAALLGAAAGDPFAAHADMSSGLFVHIA